MAKRKSWIAQISANYIGPGYPALRRACTKALAELVKTSAKIARNPYGDEVQVVGPEEPLAVGEKIAKALEKLA